MTDETPTRPGLPSRKPPTKAPIGATLTVEAMKPEPLIVDTRIAGLEARVHQLELENRKLRDMLRDPRMRTAT
jgi:hypothetical protein